MKLNFKESGAGNPLIILHGLLGSLDNWQTLARKFSEAFKVFTVDQRNHGQSPHSAEMNYDLMVEDLIELMDDLSLETASFIGHSMGGKTAMKFALDFPDRVSKLVVADMSPRPYPVHHKEILDALAEVDFDVLKSRKSVEEFLFSRLNNMGVVQFLSKNVYWAEKEKLGYRFNLDALRKNIGIISGWVETEKQFSKPSLFIRAGKANYLSEDESSVFRYFHAATITTIDSGHWIHTEKPEEFYGVVMGFLK